MFSITWNAGHGNSFLFFGFVHKGTDTPLKSGAKQISEKYYFKAVCYGIYKKKEQPEIYIRRAKMRGKKQKSPKSCAIQFDKSYSWAARTTLNLSTCLIYLFIIFSFFLSLHVTIVEFFPQSVILSFFSLHFFPNLFLSHTIDCCFLKCETVML